ncbi:hypothetical protein AArcSl_0201 [Halalkaliarchaeum desulfuricum]|uniref:Uncharacterized protein n=1 Tax=Halalkaliarchaeum desulfuricum TaxID=2055893 RepID=A0A343TFI4_9EURY|nr:hypothetical protein [Halalkaliarchaeum desulfuricum]AUX07856.1 hypothetical protein AArcSl_0201 [Halalkaliarchaeum desulfuricum]
MIGLTTAVYLFVYLYAIDQLQVGDGRFGVVIASDPAAMLFRRTFGTFTYEPVALFRLGVVTYLFSFNTVLGLALAALAGVNLGVSYLAWRQPAACGLGSRSAGALAGIPALLSGSACCAPVIVILLGVQLTGGLLLAFELLIPIAVILLLATLLLISRQIDPERAPV